MNLNRQQRRAQYALPSRSKPYRRTTKKHDDMVRRGLSKIDAFIGRGIRLNSKSMRPNPIRSAIARALRLGR